MIDAVLVSLAVKSLATALIVVVASIAAERGRPFWGGIAVTLPVTAGPAYVMLSLDHPPDFIAASALTSFASYPATWVFLVAAVKVAPHFSRVATLAAAPAAWAAALALQSGAWTASGAAMANIAAYGAAAWLVRRPGDHVEMQYYTLKDAADAALKGVHKAGYGNAAAIAALTPADLHGYPDNCHFLLKIAGDDLTCKTAPARA